MLLADVIVCIFNVLFKLNKPNKKKKGATFAFANE